MQEFKIFKDIYFVIENGGKPPLLDDLCSILQERE